MAVTTNVEVAGYRTENLGVIGDRASFVVSGPLAASDAAGGVFNWQNPTGKAIIIESVYVDVTTASSGACTIDVGTTATSAATSSDTLIDGVSVAATGTKDDQKDAGTNGAGAQRLASGKWVTASMATGATAGLVGRYFIKFIVAE